VPLPARQLLLVGARRSYDYRDTPKVLLILYIRKFLCIFLPDRETPIFCINTVQRSLVEEADDTASTAAAGVIDSASCTVSIVQCRGKKRMTGSLEVLWTLEAESRPDNTRGCCGAGA